MKILMLDNYDSFTYNLVHYIEDIVQQDIDVFRNNEIDIAAVGQYDIIFLSPGPGLPKDAGILMDIIKKYGANKHIFGVCLGQQAIAEVYGGSLLNLPNVYHGIATPVQITDSTEEIFKDLESPINAGRYHSWVVNPNNLPECLQVTALDEQGQIMALSHKAYNIKAVQFHPESVLTPDGKRILSNFLAMCQKTT